MKRLKKHVIYIIIVLSSLSFFASSYGKGDIFELKWIRLEPGDNRTKVITRKSREVLYAENEPILTTDDVASASARIEDWSEGHKKIAEIMPYELKPYAVLELVFTKNGWDKFAEIVPGNMGKTVGVIIDEQLIMTRWIGAPIIVYGTMTIKGLLTDQEANSVAERINSLKKSSKGVK